MSVAASDKFLLTLSIDLKQAYRRTGLVLFGGGGGGAEDSCSNIFSPALAPQKISPLD